MGEFVVLGIETDPKLQGVQANAEPEKVRRTEQRFFIRELIAYYLNKRGQGEDRVDFEHNDLMQARVRVRPAGRAESERVDPDAEHYRTVPQPVHAEELTVGEGDADWQTRDHLRVLRAEVPHQN